MYSLAALRVDGEDVSAISVNGRYWDISDIAPDVLVDDEFTRLMAVLQDWEANEPVLQSAANELAAGAGDAVPLPVPNGDSVSILAPLRFPRKALLVGANYLEHMRGDGGHSDFSKETNSPVFFMKPPTTSIVGPGMVRYPRQSHKFDYELELAVVVGRGGRNLTLDDALNHIAGYTLSLDLSARDWQRDPRHLVQFDLFGGKAFDESLPIGPGIVPAKFLQHDDIEISLRHNGILRQSANTKDMIWSIPEILVLLSEHLTLEPGDIIATGTPSGVGLSRNGFMASGDTLDAEATAIGTLHVGIID